MSPAIQTQAGNANAPVTAYPWLVYQARRGLVSIRRTVRGTGILLVASESYRDRGTVVLDVATAQRLGKALLRIADLSKEAA